MIQTQVVFLKSVVLPWSNCLFIPVSCDFNYCCFDEDTNSRNDIAKSQCAPVGRLIWTFRHNDCWPVKLDPWLLVQLLEQNTRFIGDCVHAKLLQSCLTLCDPMDCSPPGSSIHGILQAKILEWVAVPSSSGCSWPSDPTHMSLISGRFFTLWATREAHR